MSTYTPIASITLASTASSISFIGIPQTYTDLVLVCNFGAASNGFGFSLSFNGDEGTNYSTTSLRGDGSSANSNRITNSNSMYADSNLSANTGITTNSIINIMNYTNTTTNKTVLWRANNTDSSYPGAVATVGLWRNTNAITRVSFSSFSGNLAAGSIFNLYGIANAGITNVAKATGGDIVTTDGTYWYHAFLSSGVFAPTQVLNADVLVVAGGGGSAQDGGGGGAGGLQGFTSQSLSVQNYAITVGAGGVGSGQSVSNGSNSQFGSLTASIGGGGSTYRAAPNSGGSGGGASAFYTGSGGAGTAGQGNAGGGSSGGNFSGGGGGAGAAGQAAQGAIGGTGGDGVSTYSSWGLATSTGDNRSGTVWYAGGGGGWYNAPAGGKGGGGTSTNGTANTGGGAGGYIYSGGSGIVIVRYAV